jgi:hypothetical protein
MTTTTLGTAPQKSADPVRLIFMYGETVQTGKRFKLLPAQKGIETPPLL